MMMMMMISTKLWGISILLLAPSGLDDGREAKGNGSMVWQCVFPCLLLAACVHPFIYQSALVIMYSTSSNNCRSFHLKKETNKPSPYYVMPEHVSLTAADE